MKKYSSITKVNYPRTSHKRRKFWFIISLIIVCVGLLLPWLFSKVSAVVLYPFHATTVWVKNSDSFIPTYLRERSELVDELEKIRAQNATETGTQLSINRLLEENMQLRALASVSTSSDRLVARVIARPNSLPYDYMQIDRGSDYGVTVGVPVYSGLDSVVGVVVEVMPKYSFVELFTSPNFESTAYVIGPNVFSNLEGMGGGVARVRLPQGVALSVGQLVLLPGVSNGVYGEISYIENHPTQPEQYGYVVPPIAINNLYYVSVDVDAVQPRSDYDIEQTIKDSIHNSMLIKSTTIDTIAAKIKAESASTSTTTNQLGNSGTTSSTTNVNN